MEKMKKRQEEYMRKIQRIQSVFGDSVGTAGERKSPGLQHSDSLVRDEELSIGQIQTAENPMKDQSQSDLLPTKQERVRSGSRGKENHVPNFKGSTQSNSTFKGSYQRPTQ
jgi:hypothetical protein